MACSTSAHVVAHSAADGPAGAGIHCSCPRRRRFCAEGVRTRPNGEMLPKRAAGTRPPVSPDVAWREGSPSLVGAARRESRASEELPPARRRRWGLRKERQASDKTADRDHTGGHRSRPLCRVPVSLAPTPTPATVANARTVRKRGPRFDGSGVDIQRAKPMFTPAATEMRRASDSVRRPTSRTVPPRATHDATTITNGHGPSIVRCPPNAFAMVRIPSGTAVPTTEKSPT